MLSLFFLRRVFFIRENLIGNKYGYLKVIEMSYEKNSKGKSKTYCICECECGKIIKRPAYGLKHSSNVTSCGCKRSEINDKQSLNIIGNKYGRLLVIEEYNNISPREILCKCDCGKYKVIKKSDVTSGHTKSCGCLHYEKFTKGNTKDISGYISDYGVKAIKPEYLDEHGKWIWSFLCPLCGKTFNAIPAKIKNNHITSCGCRKKSAGEYMISEILNDFNIKYIEQYSFPDCKNKKSLRFDFAIINDNKIDKLIEFDGTQHYECVEFFGGEKSFEYSKKRDSVKNEYCKKNNIQLYRIKYTLDKNKLKEEITNIIYP